MTQVVPPESPPGVFETLTAYKASMTSDEARERFVAALVARMFSDEQLRILRDARIDESGTPLDLAGVIETITPEQLAERITLMLEKNPSWPDPDTVAELGVILDQLDGNGRKLLLPPGSTAAAQRLLPPADQPGQ